MADHCKTLPGVTGRIPREGGREPAIDSQALLAGATQLWISHQGEWYRLQLTRNDKLILVK